MKLLLATRNQGKVSELSHLVGALWQVLSLTDFPDVPEVEETGDTFEQNALTKALACARSTGMAALADDSGLCVDALGGRPGVRSARYAPGPDAARIEKLLQELKNASEDQRTATFHCALCLALPSGWTAIESGACRGRILQEPRGKNGFGYDPVFLLPELQRTMAELAPEEKARVSHRARAFARMRPHLAMLPQ